MVDQIWLLLPTCPLRTSEDILNANEMLTEDLDGVISITEMEFPPTLGLNKSDDGIITASDESDPWVNGNSRSQDHPTVYRPNGAIYASWGKNFKENKNFYKGNVKGYFMDRSKSIDIDTKFDFELAKNMIKNGNIH
jgi:CMP-N-acetylneuraminic acid synthetase